MQRVGVKQSTLHNQSNYYTTMEEEKIKQWNEYLLLPGAIVALIAGLISIYKDTLWFIYLPLFAITFLFIVLAVFKRETIHQFVTLWQSMSIEILNKEGNEAMFTNTIRLRALKDGAYNFTYMLYADGNIDNIKTMQGAVVDKKQEGGRLFVTTNVERPLKKREEVEHTLTAKYLQAFTNKKEYWQTAKNAPGANIKLTILTPLDRPIKDYQAYKIVGHSKVLLEQQPVRVISETKAGITLDFKQAKFLEKYRLEWTW